MDVENELPAPVEAVATSATAVWSTYCAVNVNDLTLVSPPASGTVSVHVLVAGSTIVLDHRGSVDASDVPMLRHS